MTRLILGLAAALASSTAAAQTADPAPATSGPQDLATADIAIVLTARAEEARFDGPPVGEIRLRAEPGGEVGGRYDPGLLPRLINPTVTYRDLEVTYAGGVRLDVPEPATSPPQDR